MGRKKKIFSSNYLAAIAVWEGSGAQLHGLSPAQVQERIAWYSDRLGERKRLFKTKTKSARRKIQEIDQQFLESVKKEIESDKYPYFGEAYEKHCDAARVQRLKKKGTLPVPIKLKLITSERLLLLKRYLRVSSSAKAIERMLDWIEDGGEPELSGIGLHKFRLGCKKLRVKYPRAHYGAKKDSG